MENALRCIRVRGARVHNLQNLHIDLPRGRFIVFTGPSGSGKSSLAFDTLYAEGQRRYLETLHLDSRALFDQLQRPDVDLVDGLPPTLCVGQHLHGSGPRSTLATITEIDDYLRLLWARLGTPYCPKCSLSMRRHTLAEIIDQITSSPPGSKVYLLAPLVQDEKGEHKEIFQHIRQAGFLRARVDGVLTELGDLPPLNPRQRHSIDMVVDRLVLRGGIQERLNDSLHAALKHGRGTIVVTDIDSGDWNDRRFCTSNNCPKCGMDFGDLEPNLFNFNSPHGACPACGGLAARSQESGGSLDEDDVEQEPTDCEPIGIVCPECAGTRLNLKARSVRYAGKGIQEIAALTIEEARNVFDGLLKEPTPSEVDVKVRDRIVTEILHRLRFLEEVGLGYLTLDRPGPTLSGGEAQRARLATHLGNGLLGVCYVLDEPTIGLHPRDTARLLSALRGLQSHGNTLIVVEHDEAVIRQADYLMDLGPGAGRNGGRILAQGSVAEVLANPASVTAPFLRPSEPDAPARGATVSLPAEPDAHARDSGPLSLARRAQITIRGARLHNLKNIDVRIPLGRMVCITGVSGSGKSTLARDILCNSTRRWLKDGKGVRQANRSSHYGIDGLDEIDKVIEVDQSPLGRTSRSNPATYTGLFDEVRKVFAGTRLAKARGHKPNRFSFNVKGGRCEECQGQGSLRVALQFLPDLTVPCPLCRGKRFNRSTLEITYRGRSVADVLDMPVAEAREFFENIPSLVRPLDSLVEVGLGYITLGQPSGALSGGEAQRVKLAAELARPATGKTLYLLDEPTTGLHFADVANLLRVLRRLVEAGNTLVVIEHHLDMIAAADWIIDLGPEGGHAGGYLVAEGAPEQVLRCPESITGQFLRSRRPA